MRNQWILWMASALALAVLSLSYTDQSLPERPSGTTIHKPNQKGDRKPGTFIHLPGADGEMVKLKLQVASSAVRDGRLNFPDQSALLGLVSFQVQGARPEPYDLNMLEVEPGDERPLSVQTPQSSAASVNVRTLGQHSAALQIGSKQLGELDLPYELFITALLPVTDSKSEKRANAQMPGNIGQDLPLAEGNPFLQALRQVQSRNAESALQRNQPRSEQQQTNSQASQENSSTSSIVGSRGINVSRLVTGAGKKYILISGAQDKALDVLVFNKSTSNPELSALVDRPMSGKGDLVVSNVQRFQPMVVLGDLNGDRREDLILTGTYTSYIFVNLANEQGELINKARIMKGGQAVSVAAGNLNRDRRQDLAILPMDTGYISILLARGLDQYDFYANVFVGASSTAVLAGDDNGDGLDDLEVIDLYNRRATVYVNVNGQFASGQDRGFDPAQFQVLSEDLLNNGRQQAVMLHRFGNSLAVFTGNASGNFFHLVTLQLPSAYSLLLGDLQNAGTIDLAILRATP